MWTSQGPSKIQGLSPLVRFGRYGQINLTFGGRVGAAEPTSRIRRRWAQEDGTILHLRLFEGQGCNRSAHLDPSGLIRPWDGVGGGHEACMTAPSITTPLVTYFQNATRSFRAKATTVVFRIRPPLRCTRSKNHWLKAEVG